LDLASSATTGKGSREQVGAAVDVAMMVMLYTVVQRLTKKPLYQVFVKTLTGKTITLDILHSDDIASLKAMVEEKTGIPANIQRLVFAGKDLDDDKTNIEKEGMLHVLLRLMGGGKRGRGAITTTEFDKDQVLIASLTSVEDQARSLADFGDAAVVDAVRHVNEAKEHVIGNPFILKHYLTQMTRDQLLKLTNVMGPENKNLPQKQKALKSCLFGADVMQFRLKEGKFKACEALQEQLTLLLFQKGYMNNEGAVEWKSIKNDVDDAIKAIDEREGEQKALQRMRDAGLMV
jgi:hypothetical protein